MKNLRPAFRTVAAAAASMLLLAGCAAGSPDGTGNSTTSSGLAGTNTVAAGLEKFYTQTVDWSPCEADAGDGFECAKILVPMDYERPAAETISLALLRKQATGERAGSLLVNPGGPGGSGYDFVRDAAASTLASLNSGYDVVGFDPRGVSRSTPVTCQTAAEQDAARQKQYDTSTDEGLAEVEAASRDYAEACAERTGVSLAYVDTVSAARDLDVLRAVTGDEKLNYLGFSYGTKLGATYAGLFPEKVGRMVLDGAVDPALSDEDLTLGKAKAFESAIQAYLQSCLASARCPFTGSVDNASKQLQDLLESVEESPMTAADGRLVPIITFVSGFILPLYDNASWPVLTQALTEAMNGNPTTMLWLADLGAGRNEDGTYSGNSSDAHSAINCLDYPMVTDVEGQRQDAKELEVASPTIGKYLAFGGFTCKAWKYPPTGSPAPISAEGAAPIVVIGTTGDPATPYEWSQSMAKQLDSAVFLTYRGHGHTAYGRAGSCIQDPVDAYLLEGKVPRDGLTC
ncbi:alpha/beta hydrolase [Zafaria cholistanensis]|uniref:Alpha/beta hydrolase n=1 Tax=Zafaria cholistanensis TaxID=1682741 RepID=A0A5A7NSB6_9MICC|nr:alpha/beta hydrolase [Zafaria cholistanensis]GER22857.1 alpha/beta hydrolase [Zafaria cholistanensis]